MIEEAPLVKTHVVKELTIRVVVPLPVRLRARIGAAIIELGSLVGGFRRPRYEAARDEDGSPRGGLRVVVYPGGV